MSNVDLAGRRILVVKDDASLAISIDDEIEDHAGIVIGPVSTLEQGINSLRDEKPDVCIVNINQGPNKV